MALEREVQARGLDASNLTATLQTATDLSAAAANALVLLGQMATRLTGYATQLASLAASGLNDQTAGPAAGTAYTTWQGAQQSLTQLVPAEQTWQSIGSLSSARLGSLQTQWQIVRPVAPPTDPTVFGDAVLNGLSVYAAFATDATLRSTLSAQMPSQPIPPVPPVQPTAGTYTAQVIGFLNTLATTYTTLATSANATVTRLSSSAYAWAGVVAAAQAATPLAQQRLQAAQQIATAVGTGGVPTNPTTLAGLLAQLADLRVNAWPGAVPPGASGVYAFRMQELDAAVVGLLNGSTGVATNVPLALLPVRLETRLMSPATGGTELRVRVFVDDLHINAHDRSMTADEAAWSAQLQAAIAVGGDTAKLTWARTANRFGARRAAYLLHPDTSAPTRSTAWQQAATAGCLPDRWLLVAYGPNRTPLGAALGRAIVSPLQVGPDPTYTQPPPGSAQAPTDPGLNWLVDFSAAETAGMALRLPLDGGTTWPTSGPNPGMPTLSRVVVVGVRSADAAADFTQLLAAHHYTDGLEVISPGTPTNSTADAPSGYSSADPGFGHDFDLEVGFPTAGPPSGDVLRLAAALGLTPAPFAAAGPPLQALTDQQAAIALAWPATWGYLLSRMTALASDRIERLRSWSAAWLRPNGPLPTLRIGRQPYGILPAMGLQAWADTDLAAADVYSIVNHLLPVWTAAYDTRLRGQLDFDALLERRATSAEMRGRLAAILGAFGTTPAWLTAGNGLLGVGASPIQARLQSLPGWLTQIGQQLGLGGAVTWPQAYAVLPDWTQGPAAQAWPVTAWSGGVPLSVAGPDAYLGALSARQTAPAVTSVVDALAASAWARTTGAATSPARALTKRGAMGETAEPPPPSAADELSASVTYLAARTDGLADVYGGAIDAASHRLDAWATALASQRLGQLRQAQSGAQKLTLRVGGFGWVEDLQQRPALQPRVVANEPNAVSDPGNAGFMQAPSVQQAATAAVLRSGYLTHNPPGSPPLATAPFAINVSSRRARLAVEILDGIHQGQPLAVLLGYRFERALQEAGRADLIAPIRQAFPYDPAVAPNGVALEAAEAVRATDVVDGVSLLSHYQSGGLTTQSWYVPVVVQALKALDESADAVADTVLAQGVHDSLTGSTSRAAATFEAVASGGVAPPDPEFLRTPRTGIAVNHRVLLPLPTATALPAGWPITPRCAAEPALAGWLAGLLGDPTRTVATVSLLDASGASLTGADAAVAVTLAQLGGPLDLLALADRPAELERQAVYMVLSARSGMAPPAADGVLNVSPPGVAVSLGDLLSVVRSAARLLSGSRAADARDLTPASSASDPAVDLADLQTRSSRAVTDLGGAAQALDTALSATPADSRALGSALISAARVGVIGASPAGFGPAALTVLSGQAQAAAAEIMRRQADLANAAAISADPALALGAYLDRLRTVFGAGFVATPRMSLTPTNILTQAQSLTNVDLSDPGQTPEAWIWKAAHVHQPLADLLETQSGAEALATGAPLNVSVAQLPLPASATRWMGQTLPVGSARPANVLSLVFAAPAPPIGTLSALLVDDWVEVIPNDRETTGVAYHYNAPGAQAPQAILLAVPSNRATAVWSYAGLLDTLSTTINLTHARAVDYADLPQPAQLVLPALYLENGPDGRPLPLPVSTPADYLVQEPSQQTITSVSGASVIQGGTGTLTVYGTNLTTAAFVFDAAGVTITTHSVTPGTTDVATLGVSVDREAVPGPRGIKVGTGNFTNNAVIVNWRPRVDTCDTSQLAQTMDDIEPTVTVQGHGLTNATATLTGSTIASISSYATSDTTLSISVSIWASSYDPTYSSDWDPSMGPYQKPRTNRPPVHANVPLTLTVTPRNGTATTFTINLDTIR